MPVVEVEGVGLVELSDEWDEQQIRDFIKEKFGDGGDEEAADPETSWFFERFGKAFGKSYKAAEDGLAIGQLVVANDKKFAIDLLEGEFNQWQNSAGEGEEPPAFLSMAGMGEIFGGVTRDIGVGVGVGALATPATTPIGGIIAGAAATTSLQALTAKGASFKDAYIQIRAKQLERGVDDKEAAYETARKISNADAAFAAAETVVSTAAPGFGKLGTRAITKGVGKVGGRVMSRGAVDVTGKAISELGLDAAVGGAGSIASDLTAEALGGEQGVDRGDIWENAAKASLAEPLVGLAPSLIRTRARHKEFKKQEKFLDDALERGHQYKSDQQEIEAQTDIIVQRGLEQEREQARRLREGEVPPAERERRAAQRTPVVIEGKPIRVEDRLVLPPDARNVPPPGMGIPVDENVMATGEGVSPILDARGEVILSPSTTIDPVTRVEPPTTFQTELGTHLDAGTEARAMQAQRARAAAAFSRMGHDRLGEAIGWVDNRIKQLAAMQERGAKDPKAEFPIEEGQLEFQFGWPEDGPTLDSLGFNEDVARVLNPNLGLTAPSPGLDISHELERLSDLRGRFAARQSEIKFAEKEAEVTGVKVTDHREPKAVPLDVELDLSPPKPVKVFHSGFSKSSKEEMGAATEAGVGMGISIIPTPSKPNQRIGTKQVKRSLDYVANGGTLFIDNGAFGLYKRGLEVPFEGDKNAFEVIDSIVYDSEKHGAGVAPENRKNVTLVMPDVIGDQQGTMELQAKHKEKIHKYIDDGFDVIIPIHQTEPSTKSKKKRGADRTLENVYDGLVAEFGEGNFRVGVPSNKAAINLKDFTGLVENKKPAKIHLLGKSKNSTDGLAKYKAAAKVSPETEVSVDSSTAAQAAKLLEGTEEKPNLKQKERSERLRGIARTKRGAEAFRTGLAGEYIDIIDAEVPGFVEGLGLDSKHADLLQDQMDRTVGSYTFGEFLEDIVEMDGGDIYAEPSGRARDYLEKAIQFSQQPGASEKAAAWGKTMLELEADRVSKGHPSEPLAEVVQQVERDARAEGVKESIHQQKVEEAKNEVKAAGRELVDPTKVSMGIDPTPIWKAFKGLVKLAYYHGARGAKSAAEFAQRAGLNLTAAVKKAWEVYKSKRAIRPREMGAQVTAELFDSDKTMTAEGQAKQAIRDRIENLVNPGRRLEFHFLGKDRRVNRTDAHRGFADRFIGLKNLQDHYAKGEDIPDTNNTYQAEQLMQGILGAKLSDFETEITGILQQIRGLGLDSRNVEAYLYARHAKERNEQIAKINKRFPDGGSGMTNAEADAIMEKAVDSGKLEAYQKIAALIDSINQRTLQIQFEGGLINEQEYNALSNFYENYVPLKGHQDSDPLVRRTGNHVSINSDIRGKDNPYALGHGERSKDILAHVFEQHANAIARAERNAVYQTLHNWVQANPDNGVITLAEPTMEQRRTPAKTATVDGKEYVIEEAEVKLVKQPGWQNQNDVVALRVNGENVYLRVAEGAESLAKNLKSMGTSSLPSWARFLAGFQRWRALTNTMVNVEFPLSNCIRDLTTAGINLGTEETAMMQKAAMKNVLPALKAIWKGERGKISDPEMAKLYKLFRENGGKMEFTSLHGLEANLRKIDSYNRRYKGIRGATKKLLEKKAVQGAYSLMENANTAMENATRLAVFKAALDSGKATPKQAAFLARNITVNFTKKGEWGTGLNTAYLFYNASVQGSLRIVQAAKSPRVQKILGGIIAMGAFENLMNQMVGEEDEDGLTDYDKVPEYIKQSNMVIPVPDFLGLKRKFVTIPLPYGYNAFYYAGKQVTSVIPVLGGKKTIGAATADTLDATLNAFNPIGGAGNVFRSLTPEVLKPVIDIATNEDWKGDRIMPDRNPFEKYRVPDSELKWATASTPAVTAARKLNALAGGSRTRSAGWADISPETMDYAVQFLTGGMGQSISRVIDLPFKTAEGTVRIEDIPIVRRFQEDPSPYFEIQKFKTIRNNAHAYEAELAILRKEKAGIRAIEDHKKEYAVDRRMLGRVKSTDSAVKKINKSIKTTEASSSLNRATKNKRLEVLNDRKQRLLRRANKRWYDLVNEE